ncbi:hypothetical protein DFH94DRAFT_731780 [Russula ochroleuca]|jgi:hypothetical protein|uniref:Uncharacterized protein n=1 Tax=Russula ochroleuca TaxID=152965 RepID=A0A9P5TA77_9AGAM|nr:hypothetical protein DFH94DRAFT_731780 [Russula ochroleuca]
MQKYDVRQAKILHLWWLATCLTNLIGVPVHPGNPWAASRPTHLPLHLPGPPYLDSATTVLMRTIVGNFLLWVLLLPWRGHGYDMTQYITVRWPFLPLRLEKKNASGCERGGCPRRLANRKE